MGWFDEQIRQRTESDQSVLEDSFFRMASAVLDKWGTEQLEDERMISRQAVDDILDVVGDEKTLGKSIGKDAAEGKLTYVTLLGVEKTKQEIDSLAADIRQILNSYDQFHFPFKLKNTTHYFLFSSSSNVIL